MGNEKIDKRIKQFVHSCQQTNHRLLLFIIGPKASDQVSVFYDLLLEEKSQKPSVLYMSENASNILSGNTTTSAHTSISDGTAVSRDVLPEFQYCSYSEIDSKFHQLMDIAVFQDFEAITPYILSSVTENVQAGGMIIFLLPNLNTFEDLSQVKTNLHKSFKSNGNFFSRFNQRLVLSTVTCANCLILNDNLSIITSKEVKHADFKNMSKETHKELQEFKMSHQSDETLGPLIKLCRTLEQAKLVEKFLNILKQKKSRFTLSVSSPKGRGKSASLGLAIAGCLPMNYSNVFISSLNIHHVKTLFRFLLKGLDAMGYKEDKDYDVIVSTNPELKDAIIGINVFKQHPQGIRFVFPSDIGDKLEQAELLVIDEAAAIPLPQLKQLTGSHIIFMASTTSGYGAVGTSLADNVANNLRYRSGERENTAMAALLPNAGDHFENVVLQEPIHYGIHDPVDIWLHRLLCLESSISSQLAFGCPEPQQCKLYYINREMLFSHSTHAEAFLQQLMSLFNSYKTKNSPEDLIRMADDPNHHLFCLLPPHLTKTPEVLCALQVHIEKQIPKHIVFSGSNIRGRVPDCIMNWENEADIDNFHSVSGIHILDIATHPDYLRMGYGFQAVRLLQEYCEGKWISLEETPKEKSIPDSDKTFQPLFIELTEIKLEKVDYFFVKFSLNSNLLKFWKKSGFAPVFIANELDEASQFSCFMVKSFENNFLPVLQSNVDYFREYFFVLLSAECKDLASALALSLLDFKLERQQSPSEMTKERIDVYIKPRRMKQLEKYCSNLGDLHCIMPSLPIITKLYFRQCFKDVTLPRVQEAILLCMGLQHKIARDTATDLKLPSSQILGLLNRSIRKITTHLIQIIEKAVEESLDFGGPRPEMTPVDQDLDEELEEAARQIQEKQLRETNKLKEMDFSEFAIKGSEDEWQKALKANRKTLVSIKSLKAPKKEEKEGEESQKTAGPKSKKRSSKEMSGYKKAKPKKNKKKKKK